MKFDMIDLGGSGQAARKLVEIANASEAVRKGDPYIALINGPFLKEGGTPTDTDEGIERR